MGSRKWLLLAVALCGLASACSQYNTNLSIQTSSSTLSYVSPKTATAGSQGFTITATGSGFTSGAILLWNGAALATTFVNGGQLTATVPASDLTSAGTVQIAVQIPGSATSGTSNVYNTTTTELSNIVLFAVSAAPGPAPVIGSISPSSAPFCSSPNGFTLTVNAASGTTFTSDSIVTWNGSQRSTTAVSSTQLTAPILPTDTASSTPAVVAVSNSSGISQGVSFTMTSPPSGLAAPQAVSKLTPASAFAGGQALPVKVMGGSFLPCSVVQWNGSTLSSTTYVSPSELDAVIPAADLASAGTAQISVFTPGPGGGTTYVPPPNPIPAHAAFSVNQPPAPNNISLSASTTSSASTPYCSTSSFTLTVNGTGFVNGSVINWNGSALSSASTTFVSATQLSAVIPYTDTLTQQTLPATIPVTVSNGSLVSTPAMFTLTAPATNFPAPATTMLTPTSAPAGSALAIPLLITGSNFLPCSVIQWGTTSLPTNYLSPAQLSTTITPVQIAAVGTGSVSVTVVNPSPGGGTSTPPLTFTVAAPTITSLSASTTSMAATPSCSTSPLTLTVEGTNFVPGEVVNWNGSPRPTTFASSTQLQVAISATDTAFLATGLAAPAINVSNGSLITSSLKFSLTAPTAPGMAPAPAIATLTPSSAATETAPGAALLLTVSGSNFYPCSSVNWSNSAALVTPLPAVVFVGPTAINTLIPATNLTSVGNNQVTVTNGTPVLTTVNPNTGQQGQTNESVNLTGQFTHWVQGSSTASFGAGITVATLTVNSATTATAALNIDPAAAAGARNVTVTTGAEVVTLNNGFTVTSPASAPFQVFSSSSVSTSPAGIGGQLALPLMSSDQRYGVYVLASTDGTTEKPGTTKEIFLADTCTGAASGCTPSNTLVSVGVGSNNGDSISPSISADSVAADNADGRYVVFLSSATNLLASGMTSGVQVFVRDTCVRAPSGSNCVPSTQLVSVANGGTTQGNGDSTSATISANGRYVTFASSATNLVANTPMSGGIFLRDTCAGASGCTPSTQLLSTQSQ